MLSGEREEARWPFILHTRAMNLWWHWPMRAPGAPGRPHNWWAGTEKPALHFIWGWSFLWDQRSKKLEFKAPSSKGQWEGRDGNERALVIGDWERGGLCRRREVPELKASYFWKNSATVLLAEWLRDRWNRYIRRSPAWVRHGWPGCERG